MSSVMTLKRYPSQGGMTFGKIGARKLVSLTQEESMYKEILDAMIRNTEGFSVDLSGVFPFDEPMVTFAVNGYLASGQIFRYNKFTSINLGNLELGNSYGFSSTKLKTVVCGKVDNNSVTFEACPALTDVYARNQASTHLIKQTAIFNSSPSAQNKQITWHCGADGKKITWNETTGQWDISDDI